MSDELVFPFVRAEEDRRTLTVYYLTKQGESSVTFSRRGQPEGYALKSYSSSAWSRSTNDEIVEMYFCIAGFEGWHLFREVDEAGNTVKEGVLVTHNLKVKLSGEDGVRLSRKLSAFIRPAESLVNGYKPHLDDLAFGDDHFTITDAYDTFTFGVNTDRYRFTFTEYGLRDAPIRGFLYLWFSFTDEHGAPHTAHFAVTDDDAARLYPDLKAYLGAHQKTNKMLEGIA